ncbi:MAG: aminoacyl-tRNA hydrolase [Phycisphaerae bacterium]
MPDVFLMPDARSLMPPVPPMKLIVGLGNPGSEYTRTRHNAGFMVIDRLAETHAKGAIPKARFKAVTIDAELKGPQGPERCVLMKPTTYMNLSGQAVGEAIRFFKLQPSTDLLVLVDDFYLPVGAVRIRDAGGSGVYPRVRIGVGEKPSGGKPANWDQADYVLSAFREDEWADLQPALETAAKAVEVFATSGLTKAMNQFNGGAAAHQARQASRPKPEARPEIKQETKSETKPETSVSQANQKVE